MTKRAFWIGDAHGAHDLIEGLLRKACILTDQGRSPNVLVGQIGDLCNCVAESIEDDLVCLSSETLDLFDVVLVGNHEHPYFGGPPFVGYWQDEEVRRALFRLRDSGKLKISWRRGDLLVTHAGVCSGWFDTARSAQATLAARWAINPRADVFSSSNGVLWLQGRTEQRFRQIIGHTPRQDGPHWEGTTLNIDIGGKHFHQLAGVWVEPDGTVGDVIRYSDRAETCPSCGGDARNHWFDRTICPCADVMHTRCRTCGYALDDCLLEESRA